MGQKPQTPLKSKPHYDPTPFQEPLSSAQSHIELLTIIQRSQPQIQLSPHTSVLSLSQGSSHSPQLTLQSVNRQQSLLEFIGEIIYYCKLHMKKQRKYKYKISALLFYKYFFDKFRQLLTKYYILYQQGVISYDEYEEKVALVCQVKDTYLTIRKFVYSKIPFLSQRTKSYLDEDDAQRYCFNDKEFFTQLLYPEVGDILKSYFQSTNGELHEAGVNQCYMRMVRSVFIIQELEQSTKNTIITPSVSCHIGDIEEWQDQKIRQNLKRDYERFMIQFIQLS